MKDGTKQQFDEAFSQYERKLEQQRQAKVAQETREEEFVRIFRERCASTIKPALERISGYLQTKGMETAIVQTPERSAQDGRVEAREEISLRILAITGCPPGNRQSYEVPHFSLRPDKSKQEIQLSQSTIGLGRGGHGGGIGTVKMEQVTEELLEERVLAFVRELLR